MPFKEDELRLQFLEKARYYEELRTCVLNKIQNEIKSNFTTPIKYFKTRIKTFERFKKKAESKGYATLPDVFYSINDLLGVRLICLYKTELQGICDWVEVNFEKIDREIFQWQGLGDLQPSNDELQKRWKRVIHLFTMLLGFEILNQG
jgi:ppGpp synthetase/RelA/SpoT-type nucleotidyltranferase